MDDYNGTMRICVNDDGNEGNGKDGDGDGDGDGNHGNGDGNGNGDGDAYDVAAVDSKDVDEDNGGNSRTTIGRQQWDNVKVC
jgi:hypothetical protein